MVASLSLLSIENNLTARYRWVSDSRKCRCAPKNRDSFNSGNGLTHGSVFFPKEQLRHLGHPKSYKQRFFACSHNEIHCKHSSIWSPRFRELEFATRQKTMIWQRNHLTIRRWYSLYIIIWYHLIINFPDSYHRSSKTDNLHF